MVEPINFWVDQNDMVSKPILLIFIIIEIQVLVVIFVLYRTSIRNFVKSSKLAFGQNFFASQPNYLFPVLHSSYIGLLLIVLSSLVSHVSGLLSNKKAYLFVGFKDLLSILGLILFGLSILQIRKYFISFQQIKGRALNHKYFVLIFVMFSIIILSGAIIILFSNITSLLTIYQVILIILIFAMFLIILQNFSYKYYQNEVLKSRFLIINTIYLSFPVYLLIVLFFVPSTRTLPSEYLTRNPIVNSFIVFTTFWALFNSIMFYLLTVFPNYLQKLVNISKEDFDIYRDESFDSADPLDIYHEIKNPKNIEINFNIEETSYVILTDLDNENISESSFLKPIIEFTKMDQILSVKSYDDSSFRNLVLEHHGIFFVSTSQNPQLSDLFSKIHEHYGWDLEYSNRISYDGFEYFSDNREFALLIVIPSFWDFNSKLWLVVFPKVLETVMNNFFSKYLKWLDQRSNEDILFLILTFYVDENENCYPIPPDPDNDDMPNDEYVLFF